ncbi:MAG: MBL fold metallo-hydrolase [Chloroflexi bacterium]|nr:MBL fold metallo-hydrolase [Chloroflexota bacterium]
MPTIQRLELPTPFPVGPVNAYLLEGDPLTLVDTGPREAATLPVLRAELERRGVTFRDLERLVITHPHIDHFGLAAAIVTDSTDARAERSSGPAVEVLAHPDAVPWLSDGLSVGVARHRFYLDVLREAGMPDPDPVARAYLAADQYGAPVRVDRVLTHGEGVRLGGTDWQVIHTPGHAGAHLCLYDPESRALVAGDHLLPTISSNPVVEPALDGRLRHRSLVGYVRSLRLVAELEVATVYPGHGAPFEGHRELIEQRLAATWQRAEDIAALLADGRPSIYEVVQQLFPNVSGFEAFLGVSEIIGHLELLEAQGRVAAERDGHVMRYRRL